MRVHCGNPGIPMPALVGEAPESTTILHEHEMWTLVDHVLSVSGKGPVASQ